MANEFVARNGLISQNNSTVTGSLTVTNGITGSLFGTASWASNSITSSYILNAVSASFASTASFLPVGTYSITSSWATNALTASFLPVGTYNITSSWTQSASQAISSSFVTTASYALNGGVTQIIAGTNISISPSNGLGAVTITSTGGGGSSTQIATGSVTASVSLTQFSVVSGSTTEFVVAGTGVTIGSVITDTHRVTGSLNISGSATATSGFSGSFSGSFFGNGAGLTGITATADTTAIEAQVWFLT
jgi:hypothetical protein